MVLVLSPKLESNNYDIAFLGCVFKDRNIINQYGGTDCGSYYYSDPDKLITLIKIPRDQVCRKDGSESFNCPSSPYSVEEIIVADYRKGDSLMLLGFERNRSIISSHQEYFPIGNSRLLAPLHFWMQIRRTDEAVCPMYRSSDSYYTCYDWVNSVYRNVVDWNYSEAIVLSQFSGSGSTITINNNEWKYTLRLELKE